MADPILYGPAYSTYARTARLALEEKGVTYRLQEVDMLKGATALPDYLARQPFGKVPAFEHDGFALYETVAIARYIDEAFPGPKLQPADVRQRARMQQAISVIDSYTYTPCITHIAVQRLIQPMMGGQTDVAVVEKALPNARKALKALSDILGGGKWLAGPELSLADLHLIPIMAYFSQTPEGQKLAAELPSLNDWWRRAGDRSSVAKTAPKFG